MRWHVIWVGRRAADPLLAAAADYTTRLGRCVRLQVTMVRDGTQAAETRGLLAAVPRAAHLIACDARGTAHTTAGLATALAALGRRGTRELAFVIGGADGLGAEVRARADACWALSALTLPHRLALVTLLEQLYRVQTIWQGGPYHRA